MMKFAILLLLLFFGPVRLDSIDFEDCGSNFHLLDVNIEGCTSVPCCLTIGGQHSISMNFLSIENSEILTQQVYLILKTIHSGLDVTPDDPCDHIPCPVNNNMEVTFSAKMNINSTLVPLNGELKWTLFNGSGDTMLCMKTEIGLQSSGEDADTCKSFRKT